LHWIENYLLGNRQEVENSHVEKGEAALEIGQCIAAESILSSAQYILLLPALWMLYLKVLETRTISS
jgi:hypothetical protein